MEGTKLYNQSSFFVLRVEGLSDSDVSYIIHTVEQLDFMRYDVNTGTDCDEGTLLEEVSKTPVSPQTCEKEISKAQLSCYAYYG
jgi:hypothetical protein